MKRLTVLPIPATILALAVSSCVNPHEAEFNTRMAAERAAQKVQDEKRATEQERQRAEEKRLLERAREDFFAANPRLTPEERSAIIEKRPIVGLTLQQAWDLIGPMRKITESDGVGGNWAMYESAGYRFQKWRLFFQNGRLVRWIEI